MFHAAESVNEAPKPTIDWKVEFGFTVIVEPLPPEPNVTSPCLVSAFDLSAVVNHTLALVAAVAAGEDTKVLPTVTTAAASAIPRQRAVIFDIALLAGV
ncbi:hypothetical protein Lesp01_08930 [Lentzea sp. NBRC 102530]|nr:hypothetical protein Lesp01_08930 [Lentzea sp. NBRC 102530]